MQIPYVAVILVLIVLAGIGYYISVPTAKSTLIIAVKDTSKQSKYGTIASLSLTFSEVSVHKALAEGTINTTTEEMSISESNETENAGWIKVVDEVQTVDLLQFTEVSKVLGQEVLDSGKYTQIRLKIDSGTVIIDGETYDLIIPSRFLKLNRGFVLEPDVDMKLTLDFKAEKSVVKTGNDEFKLKPVIAVISEMLTTTTLPEETTTVTTTTLPEETTTTVTTTQTTTTVPITGDGILVMKIKDKLDLTNITSIDLTISKVEVHKAGADEDETPSNETLETNDTSPAGWITVVDETNSYNLLELVDTPGEVLGEETLSAGKYTKIRLYVSKAELTLENETYDVKVPSKRFYWIRPFYIHSGMTTTLTLDFDAADSIVETGANEFRLKPVVKVIMEIFTTTTTTSSTTTTTLNETTTTTIPVNETTTTTLFNETTTTTLETTTTTLPVNQTTTTTTKTTTTTVPENTTTTTV
jgi:hypothetical protein